MKQRPLVKLAVFNILTLGLYEFRWLALTRKELMAAGDSRIPPIGRLIALRATALVVLAVALWSLYPVLRPYQPAQPPPAACLSRYDADPACRQAIDTYYQSDHGLSGLAMFFVCLVLLAGLYWFSLRWLVPYCEAVGHVTGPGPDNTLMYLLLMYSPGIGMLVMQDRFNHLPGSVPSAPERQ